MNRAYIAYNACLPPKRRDEMCIRDSLINLVSLRTGYSIGGFDADKIQGDSLELGIGRAEEPFAPPNPPEQPM